MISSYLFSRKILSQIFLRNLAWTRIHIMIVCHKRCCIHFFCTLDADYRLWFLDQVENKLRKWKQPRIFRTELSELFIMCTDFIDSRIIRTKRGGLIMEFFDLNSFGFQYALLCMLPSPYEILQCFH